MIAGNHTTTTTVISFFLLSFTAFNKKVHHICKRTQVRLLILVQVQE